MAADPTAAVERLHEAMNRHDLDPFAVCFDPDERSQQLAHPNRAFGAYEQVHTNGGGFVATVPDFPAEFAASHLTAGSEIETNRRCPRINVLRRLAIAVGVPTPQAATFERERQLQRFRRWSAKIVVQNTAVHNRTAQCGIPMIADRLPYGIAGVLVVVINFGVHLVPGDGLRATGNRHHLSLLVVGRSGQRKVCRASSMRRRTTTKAAARER